MKAPTIKHEDYAVIADCIAVSFERDLASFSQIYRTMNAEYLENFKKAISKLKNNDSTNSIVVKQKKTIQTGRRTPKKYYFFEGLC